MISFTKRGDDRGSLVALEAGRNIPFDVKRVYYIYATTPGVRRGFHAHKNLKQVAIAVNGSCKILLDNGQEKRSVELSSPEAGLVIEGHVWREMYDFTSDCVLLVLADQLYDEDDYIRDYDEFLKFINKAER